ncbi:Rha family transcriptional regulator, partial [Apilactobacillus micheneri]
MVMKSNIINIEKTVDSRLIAEETGDRHSEVMRKISTMIGYISENAKLRSQDYFIKSNYKAKGNNKTYPCYLLTKMGCEMYA